MNEQRFELMMKELDGEHEAGGPVRAQMYQEKVIDKLPPLQKLSFYWHMKNYDRYPNIQHIKIV